MTSRPSRNPTDRIALVRQHSAGKYSQFPRSRLTASGSPFSTVRPVNFGR